MPRTRQKAKSKNGNVSAKLPPRQQSSLGATRKLPTSGGKLNPLSPHAWPASYRIRDNRLLSMLRAPTPSTPASIPRRQLAKARAQLGAEGYDVIDPVEESKPYIREAKALKDEVRDDVKGVVNSLTSVASAYGRQIKNLPPRIKHVEVDGTPGISIRHREYVGDFNGTTSFSTFEYDMNPSSADTFPWLASQSGLWQYYKFRNLKFSFNTTQGTGVGGVIMAAMIFDPNEPIPSSKNAMLNYDGAQRSVAWQAMDISAPRIALNQVSQRNVGRGFDLSINGLEMLSSDEIDANDDTRFSSTGKLVVATDGYATTSNVGELWVEYEILLTLPRPASMSMQSCSVQSGVAAASAGNMLNMHRWTSPPGNLALYPDPSATNKVFFSSTGTYLMTIFLSGNAMALSNIPQFVGSGAGPVRGSSTPSFSTTVQIVTVDDADFSIELADYVTGGTSITCYLTASRIAPGSGF